MNCPATPGVTHLPLHDGIPIWTQTEGEHEETPAVGHGEAHRPGPGVEQRAVEARRGPQGPVRRRGVGVPDAAATAVLTQLEPRHRPRATPRADGHPEVAVKPAIRAAGRITLPPFVPQLALKRQVE